MQQRAFRTHLFIHNAIACWNKLQILISKISSQNQITLSIRNQKIGNAEKCFMTVMFEREEKWMLIKKAKDNDVPWFNLLFQKLCPICCAD